MKNKLLTAVIVVAVLAAGVWWFNGGSSSVSLYSDSNISPTDVVVASKPIAYKATRTATPVPPTSTLSYSQLVAQYGSNRIQFNASCQASPSSMVLKNSTGILLDNRSNKTQVITLNGASYTLVPYGYRVATLSSSTLPKTIGVTCNGQVNTSTINLQANISGQ